MAANILPGKVWKFFPGYQKIPGTLGKLGKINDTVIRTFIVSVDRGFRPHEPNIRFAGKDGRHGFICAKPSDKIKINIFF